MEKEIDGREKRFVRIQTIHGVIEGCVLTGPQIRTLDDLNMFSRKFLRVEEAVVTSPTWSFRPGTIGINTSSILFVIERSKFKKKSGKRVEAARFNRAAVLLRVGDFDIQGFVHVPGRGDILTRLNRDKYPFMALTSASVIGPDSELAAPFLAVNRSHVMAAQDMGQEEEEPAAILEEASAGCDREA
jgi:hypothetical protein